VEVLIATSKRD